MMKKIKAALKAKGKTYLDLATRAKVSHGYVLQLMMNKNPRFPGPKMAKRLADSVEALTGKRIDPAELVRWE